MFENIFVAVLCVVAIGAAIWGLWFENGGTGEKDTKKNKDTDAS